MYQKPDDVYREVRERIDIFNQGGGFVCNAVHNVQGNSPIENVLAMFQAIKDDANEPLSSNQLALLDPDLHRRNTRRLFVRL